MLESSLPSGWDHGQGTLATADTLAYYGGGVSVGRLQGLRAVTLNPLWNLGGRTLRLSPTHRKDLSAPVLRVDHFDPPLHSTDAAPKLGMTLAEAEHRDNLLAATSRCVYDGKDFLRSLILRSASIKDSVAVR